jgi:hypothetical protein
VTFPLIQEIVIFFATDLAVADGVGAGVGVAVGAGASCSSFTLMVGDE